MTHLYVRVAEPVIIEQYEGDVVPSGVTVAVQHPDGAVSVLSDFPTFEQFQEAFIQVPVSDHMDDIALRMALERAQLHYRLQRLHAFMRTDIYRHLDEDEVQDMRLQCETMDAYLTVLSNRLARRLTKLRPAD